jgi:TRAP-type C4-dicarboxylate transport system substrate-binding protein
MFSRRQWLSRFFLLCAVGLLSPVFASPATHPVKVGIAAERTALVWAAAEKWQGQNSGLALEQAASTESLPPIDQAAIAIVPLRVFAQAVPAADVLTLPFLFEDLAAVHRAQAGKLGALLQQEAARAGWRILGYWDEGMQSMSGNQAYNRPDNLAGIEFAQLAPDAIEEKTLRALDAWPRSVRPNSQTQMAQECLVRSRAATLQTLWREGIYRVHLNLTLTRHRYEGWVVAMPAAQWQRLPLAERKRLQSGLTQATRWEQSEALQREADALQQLKKAGMEVTELNVTERAALQARLGALEDLLPDTLDASLKRRLLALATGRSASSASLNAREKPLLDPQINAPRREPGNQAR